ncbi:TPA: radical SAM protein [Candidatus Poribacteria bacterium]|nr:radical SAM protein [Candidatus Poribacteria bacterium]HIA66120.1 radical SAM protein [Candidatus Poribacteria bacterium]HIN31290.1 radical SAM protein [Candidatus Poribacteria bacterium]HIO08898.1 radical SAM protein [Candidatus Poribacteria bacterium]HIO77021.1 radical SAM protein [Candidatus Poribacteria bacterium]
MRRNDFVASLKAFGYAMASTDHPLLVHFVVIRRCNLSCAYCNEYDDISPPIPLEVIKKRIRALANLKTAIITCTGGEPLLHPDMEEIIKEIRNHNIIAFMITNGYLLTKERIQKLNEAGLQGLQISIDNLEPDDVSYKSLKVLDRKLKLLADYAKFEVNISSVLGISDERTSDAITVAERAMSYNFKHSVSILHDSNGILKPLSPKQYDVYRTIGKRSNVFSHFFNYTLFQKKLIRGETNNWKCRAGARYLYICEEGLVHWCSQQRGYPGIPLEEYTVKDIRREYKTQKDCSPLCTLTCVHQISFLDEWRSPQNRPDPING